MREAVLAAWRVERVEKPKPDYPNWKWAPLEEPAVVRFATLVREGGSALN
jgi:hypothetical protein